MPCPAGCCPSYADHLRTINIAPSATPSRNGGGEAKAINEKEARWHRDMDAYKEGRRQGLWPSRIDGSADVLSKARSQWEVETGHLFESPRESKEALEGLELAREYREELASADG